MEDGKKGINMILKCKTWTKRKRSEREKECKRRNNRVRREHGEGDL